jgi:hypothetical protein
MAASPGSLFTVNNLSHPLLHNPEDIANCLERCARLPRLGNRLIALDRTLT